MSGSRWQRAADVCTVVVCVVMLGVVGWRAFAPTAPVKQVGHHLVLPGVSFEEAQRTLVMVLQSDCSYCQESMPFYRRLLEHDRADVHVVVAAPPTDTGIGNYLASEGVNPDSVVLLESSVLSVPGTPALLVVGSDGAVTHYWIGLLDTDREVEVVEALFG